MASQPYPTKFLIFILEMIQRTLCCGVRMVVALIPCNAMIPVVSACRPLNDNASALLSDAIPTFFPHCGASP